MKKILFLALVLVVAVGMTAAAADISWSGEVNTEVQWGAGDFAKEYAEETEVELNLDVQVDEWNSLYFESDVAGDTAAWDTSPPLGIGEAALESNLGGWIGDFTGAPLPFGLTYKIGFAEWSYTDVADVSHYELENLAVEDFEAIGHQVSLTFVDMVNVYMAHGFDADLGNGDLAPTLFGVDAMIPIEGVGTLGLETVYSFYPGLEDFGDGHLGFGVFFGMPIIPDLDGELAASYTMDLDDDAVTEWYWGVGGAVNYLDGLVGASFSLGGMDDSEVSALGLGLSSAVLPDLLSFEAGIALGLDDDVWEETMNSADISMTFSPGAASFTLGYFWLNEDAPEAIGDLNAVDDSFTGPYFSAGLSF